MEIKPANMIDNIGTRSLTNLGELGSLKTIANKREQAEKVATQFESVFMEMMIKSMRETVPDGGVMGEGLGAKNYISMLDQQMAQMGGIAFDRRFHQGLVDSILDQATKAEAAAKEAAGAAGEDEKIAFSGDLSNFADK